MKRINMTELHRFRSTRDKRDSSIKYYSNKTASLLASQILPTFSSRVICINSLSSTALIPQQNVWLRSGLRWRPSNDRSIDAFTLGIRVLYLSLLNGLIVLEFFVIDIGGRFGVPLAFPRARRNWIVTGRSGLQFTDSVADSIDGTFWGFGAQLVTHPMPFMTRGQIDRIKRAMGMKNYLFMKHIVGCKHAR